MRLFLAITTIFAVIAAAIFVVFKFGNIESYVVEIPPAVQQEQEVVKKEKLPVAVKRPVKQPEPPIIEPVVPETKAELVEIPEKEVVKKIEEVAKISIPEKETNAPTPIVYKIVKAGSSSFLSYDGVFTLTNSHRAQNGHGPLEHNSLLDSAAQMKLQDMFDQQYFAHVGPDGKEPSTWVNAAGYNYKTTGENLAQGNFETDAVLVQGWMDSPGHRANILNTTFTQIGIAVGKGMFEGQETWLAVQVFGKPMPICDQPELVLKDQIEAENVKIDQTQQKINGLQNEIDSTSDVELHNQKVDEYNALIPIFNDLIEKTKALTSKFNAQVNVYNLCIDQ